MSVLIKGMKMPEDCPVCPLAHWNKLDRFTGCEIKKRYFDKEDMETRGRPDFCPLVELPPHGRLIDGDVAEVIVTDEKDEVGGFLDGILYAADWIANQPTVIEAESEDV